MGLLEQMRDGYIGKCSTLRLLRYRAPIAHSCSPNESILGTVLGVRDNGVYHLDSGEKGERMGATRDEAMPVFHGNANRKRNWSYMSLSPLHLGGAPLGKTYDFSLQLPSGQQESALQP